MTNVPALAEQIDALLRQRGVPERAAQEQRYLKSELDHYGTSVPAVRAVVKELTGKLPLHHDELIALAELLWAEPVHERRAAAAELLEQRVDQVRADDIDLLEQLLRESRTWALVDNLAASVVGPLVEREDSLGEVLDRWAADPDFWIRRSALLAHLIALRQGRGDFERFTRYADAMLEEKEFFIRKAIGWILRDTGRLRPELVYEWLLPRASRAAGLTVREAVKYLTAEQRATILAARG
ncbi:MAG: DNA alkylation repair protein [Actinobacteria bacterium]|nr:DNA alkylation repair protein [Actinomycetota bacterium]